jgi:hypothetical protein
MCGVCPGAGDDHVASSCPAATGDIPPGRGPAAHNAASRTVREPPHEHHT